MTFEHYIEEPDLSIAWAKAARALISGGGPGEVAPLVIAVTGFDSGVPRETPAIRSALDSFLASADLQSCHTVANTIFPESYWNPQLPRARFFERYSAVLPRLRAMPKNRKGLYFERMIQGGPQDHPNQLDFVLGQYGAKKGVRRSALQVSVFDPKIDQTNSALVGFPCLQHVTFAPSKEGLCINAFYATQFAVERAYGNYLGICGLGRFVAHELGLELARMTCFTGIMKRDNGLRIADLKPLAKCVSDALKAPKVAA